MAIYHLHVKVISRATGRSAVAAAAYRAAACLQDERLDRAHDFSRKEDVVHSEILMPEGAPERLRDRSVLWNEVEAGEKRKDAQLAREVEFAIPREMSQAQGIALARDFVREQFVSRGMVADLNVHWDRVEDENGQIVCKPHAHVMLSMRSVSEAGFGLKVTEWNDRGLLRVWRERWAALANERLAALDIDVRIDHRSLADQGIALEPQNKIGPAGMRREERGEEAERAAEHLEIARRNGERLLAAPVLALEALTRQQSSFTRQDLARFVHRHTVDEAQFGAVMAQVEACPELVVLGRDGYGRERFSSREMVAVEQRLEAASLALGQRQAHAVPVGLRRAAMGRNDLGEEQALALGEVTRSRDLSVVVGYAGTGKSTMLGVARSVWETAGYRVRGAALSGIAAEGLEAGSGIESRTLASLERGWVAGVDLLARGDVLVVDEAGMVGSRQMARVLSAVQDAGAKLVLVGDPEQLQAIEAGAAFRAVAERVGSVEITTVRRQGAGWQQEATKELATGRTGTALDRYEAAGMVRGHETLEAARAAVVASWRAGGGATSGCRQIMLAHRRVDVRALNEAARSLCLEAGELDRERALSVMTAQGERVFAPGDRVYFLRNDRGFGVKNGTLGTICDLSGDDEVGVVVSVRLDGARVGDVGHVVSVSLRAYDALDHGYAATIHKAQGVTVDRAHVLATGSMDRHGAYVALSRHREAVSVHWAQDDVGDRDGLVRRLSRERLKDTTLDYPQGPGGGRQSSERSARAYARRRGLGVPESRIVLPELGEDPFAGLDLGVAARGQDDAFASLRLNPDRRVPVAASDPQDMLERAVARYAQAFLAVGRMHEARLPVLTHQEQSLDRATKALERVRPGAIDDLLMALRHEDDVRVALLTLEGVERGVVLTRAILQEARIRRSPGLRAQRFMRVWEGLETAQARDEALVQLGKDAEMRSLLRRKGASFGVTPGSVLDLSIRALDVPKKRAPRLGHERRPEAEPAPKRDTGWSRGR
ncbi:Ti-type conjugative transfer relaxase TraA [Asaia bogorensis]|uniref:Ti-type conjugative transfer relaxase TraA n=1 Tax=Asaia bogorensis TaxID=91915 RepID=UPI000EFD09E0|nr:Ti-type conjugative transfer relaxase TraA [Asaia bogorensis]